MREYICEYLIVTWHVLPGMSLSKNNNKQRHSSYSIIDTAGGIIRLMLIIGLIMMWLMIKNNHSAKFKQERYND
jgi:hypothetical protein